MPQFFSFLLFSIRTQAGGPLVGDLERYIGLNFIWCEASGDHPVKFFVPSGLVYVLEPAKNDLFFVRSLRVAKELESVGRSGEEREDGEGEERGEEEARFHSEILTDRGGSVNLGLISGLMDSGGREHCWRRQASESRDDIASSGS